MLPIQTRGEQGEEWYRRVKLAIDELAARKIGIDIHEQAVLVADNINTLNFLGADFNISETVEGIALVSLANPFLGLTVQANDVTVDTTVTTLDFRTGLTIGESPEDEVNIEVDFGFTSSEVLQGNYWEANRSAYDGQSKSTTSTSVYSTTNMPTLNLTMPAAGTIVAELWLRAGHSADGTIDARLTIDGNNSTPIARSAPSVGGWPIYTRHERAVSAGSRTIASGFKINTTAGTATISDALLRVTGYI